MSKVFKEALKGQPTQRDSSGAAPATYRKVVNGLSRALDRDPVHTRRPSQDFELLLDEIPEAMKTKALEWYERGIKRGLARATDLMGSGKITVAEGVVYAPSEIQVNVRTKFRGEEWESREFIVASTDIGFDNASGD
ncbi:hypothetical protein [Trinickia soli]|uniref:Uncharacterized protein n=1 Tax=Trinickia soli TaxID=380675 RepID=A0A2N7VPX9_9BURK|nr:hypothetical protein [Trinickia soli]PMS19219.1 hypothetical protein C0Z19_21525 [Trinickia soli]CAB3643582.1 hypothetical protein LMG24076_00409 [Trinickia soli]